MKTTTFARNGGFVSVIVCENKKSFIVSAKTYRTKKGAENANEKLAAFCGKNYEDNNVPYRVTHNDGSVEVLYHTENRLGVS